MWKLPSTQLQGSLLLLIGCIKIHLNSFDSFSTIEHPAFPVHVAVSIHMIRQRSAERFLFLGECGIYFQTNRRSSTLSRPDAKAGAASLRVQSHVLVLSRHGLGRIAWVLQSGATIKVVSGVTSDICHCSNPRISFIWHMNHISVICKHRHPIPSNCILQPSGIKDNQVVKGQPAPLEALPESMRPK